MSTVKLHIPILVSDTRVEERPHYYLRPLFPGYPVAAHRRYDSAVVQLQKEIRQLFKGYSLNRQSAPQLLWFLFRPELQYRQIKLSLNLGKQYFEGKLGAAFFKLKGHTFGCFPSLNNFMFMAAARHSRAELDEEARRIAAVLIRRLKKEQDDDFEPESYLAGKREFITTLEVNINLAFSPFRFEESGNNWLFDSILGDTEFDGAVEIERVGQNLNALYPSELNRAFFRETEVEQTYRNLFEGSQTPLAIVGPEGVGKHTIAHEAITRYESGYYRQKKGSPQRVWHIDPTRLIAGMSIVGMWQKRLEAIIHFVQKPTEHATSSDKILIDNPVALLRIGKSAQNDMTLSDVFRPYLEKRQLQLILLASPEEWKVLQEKGRRFSQLFQVVRLREPSLDDATRIILQKRRLLERENDCSISIQAVQQLLAIQRNYLKNKPLPGSVLKLLQQLAVKYRYASVDIPEVRREFKVFSGLEEMIFDPTQQLEGREVEELIGRELVGQPQAVSALANLVHLAKAKLANQEKPLASFLFIGPTGVGKTQAAKVLSKYLMGGESQLMRFDMNEYIDGGALQRLIGDEYNPEGQLTGKVRYQPFGIVLLDEIEKAHPAVHDLLLQLLDDGRLTDSLGRTVDFTNTIIIMTSNVGAREASTHLGYQSELKDQAQVYRRAMEQEFRPEFINRIDEVIIFNSLSLSHILGIARLQIKELLQRDGFVRRTTILNISTSALEWVAQRGFDARMGGRALKRQIEKDLTALSAEQLISTYTDSPILFDILLENGQLLPRIRPIGFTRPVEANWLPALPEESKGKRFYSQLLRALESIKETLDTFEENTGMGSEPLIYADGEAYEGQGWEYYHFKANVEEARDAIRDISLGFRDRHYKFAPAIPLRLKPVKITPKKDWSAKGVRENIKDRLFQEEGIKEISEAYHFSNAQFDSLKTEFLNHFLDVAILRLQLRSVLEGKPASCRLQFSSYVSGMGEWEIKYLIDKYSALLSLLGIPHDLHEQGHYIDIGPAFGIPELFQGEEGIHLFYQARQNPVPILVSLHPSLCESPPFQVIRAYDGRDTLTDLRTGYSNAMNITANEAKLLLFAGIHPSLRRETNPLNA